MLFADLFMDWCGNFLLFLVLILAALLWSIGKVVKGTVDIAKKALEDETVQEVGGNILGNWLSNLFK